jgi:nucleotidyltransferase/DNA polymerase involved in DNA repair
MRPPAAVGHLDADCFYVSAERVRDAFLNGKPVGVLGNQGACVIAKSYEMKAAGVKTGEPIWDALKKCPRGVYLKRDFRWYEVLSRQMLDVVREFSPEVEYYSIDEFFFAAVPLRGLSLQATIEVLRDRVRQAVGVPVTVGVARTKSLAKLISDTAKPFGALAVLDRDAERALLAQRPVTEITGIAGRRAARLAPHGIVTCLDFADADRRLVRSCLTIVGEGLWYELNGEPVQPLHTRRPPHKMLSRGGSIGAHTADPRRLYGWLVRDVERLVEELEYHGVQAGRLDVSVVYRRRCGASGGGRLAGHTDRFDLLLEAARRGLRQAWVPGLPVTHLQVLATDLRWRGAVQLGLFEPPGPRAEAVARLKREVNARVGRFALRSGATLYLDDVYRDEAQSYDICDVRGKLCF